jgi:hypothetical protein
LALAKTTSSLCLKKSAFVFGNQRRVGTPTGVASLSASRAW